MVSIITKIYDFKNKPRYKNVIKKSGPCLIEVMTDNKQKIFDAFRDY